MPSSSSGAATEGSDKRHSGACCALKKGCCCSRRLCQKPSASAISSPPKRLRAPFRAAAAPDRRSARVPSSQALADPYSRYITFARNFVNIPALANVIGDPHFGTRDRMGRDLAFLCRMQVDGWASTPRGISVADLPGAQREPVSRLRLDGGIDDALTLLRTHLPQTEFTGSLLEQLHRAYRPGAGMATAFAQWLETLLGPLGLIVYDASDPAAKPLASRVFRTELSHPGRTSRLAVEAGSRLVAAGFAAQVTAGTDAVALFDMADGRRPMRWADGVFQADGARLTQDEAVRAAEQTPERFSPNVLLRPVVQDTLFPTICYVAGPNELAYLGQLRGVYDRFGVPMPLMYPRASATLLDSAAARFLAKYHLPLEALQPQDESALNQLLESQIPPEVETSLSQASAAISSSMQTVIDAIPALDPTLEGATRNTLGRMQHDLQSLHNKMIQAAKRRDETLRRQYIRTRALAFPDGHAQERTIGFVSFLNQYGPALVDRLEEELPLDMGHHWIVTI